MLYVCIFSCDVNALPCQWIRGRCLLRTFQDHHGWSHVTSCVECNNTGSLGSIKHSHAVVVLDPFKEVAPFYFIGSVALFITVIGIAAYKANFLQFGLDQLSDAPSTSLSVFIHLTVWADTLGTALMITSGAVIACPYISYKEQIGFGLIPFLILIFFPFVLAFSCCKRHWFYSEPGQRNPYKNVVEVLSFVRKHAYPLNRSAFTYCDNERPSRMDFAKERYGGPFTTEQVEDVKTFLRLLALLGCLGLAFVMDIPSSLVGFKTFGYHTGYIWDPLHRCTIWVIFESTSLMHIVGLVTLPIYVYNFVLVRRTSIFFSYVWRSDYIHPWYCLHAIH